jgi:beta-1,4-mannosyl-glycoprotein beta-1,4-N-acetylglucosaminyltransferase
MIYDCFTFFNELDLLEIRLNVLSPVVDKFVLVEADKTFTNENKPFYFEENKKRYESFLDRIIHIKINEYSFEYNSAWDMEYYQRNKISEGLKNCVFDDIILISDLDEIANPYEIVKYKNGIYGKGLFALRQLIFYYFLNYQKVITKYSCRSKIITYSTYIAENWTPQNIRMGKNNGVIKNGGWHFSWLGGYEAIKYKIKSFSHQELDNEKYVNDGIIRKIEKGHTLSDKKSDRFVPVIIKYGAFPKYIVDNQSKYKDLVYQKDINYPHNFFIYVTACISLLIEMLFPIKLFVRIAKKLLKILIGANNYQKLKEWIKKT